MWQRFTERARRVVFVAQQEALQLGNPNVDTEHVLLALVREDNIACRILLKLGVEPAGVRDALSTERLQYNPRTINFELSSRMKDVFDYSYEEVKSLQEQYIGTEHLLLGLLRDEEGLAGQALRGLGVTLESARAALRKMQAEGI